MLCTAVTASFCRLLHLQPQVCPSQCSTQAKKKFFSHSQENCIAAALDCFFKELTGPVKQDCSDPEEYIDGAIEYLQRVTESQEHNLNNNVSTSANQFG